MKVFKNKTVVTILAGIICVVILAFAYNNRVSKKIDSVDVFVAKVDLAAREQITAEKITKIKVAASALTKNVIRNEDNIKNKYVNYNTKIPEGSFFYANAVVDWSSMPDAAWGEIQDDHTVFSLPVDNQKTFGNSIYPGDKIDIYYKTNDGSLVYGPLITGIEVLAVKDSAGYHINQKTASQKDAVALIFDVSEEMFLLLKKAYYLDGGSSLVPVPRNSTYSNTESETVVSSEYLKNLINNRSKDVPLDVVSKSDNANIQVTQ